MSAPSADPVVIQRRFRGPPRSANGGYACGVVARYIDGPAEVVLRRPPPLDTPLTVERRDGTVALLEGDALVAEGHPATVGIDVPAPAGFREALLASKQSLAFDPKSPYRTCFVCGADRGPGDGLQVYPGPLPDRDALGAAWEPDAPLADEHGIVLPEYVWSVLDCPGGFAAGASPDLLVVLGTFAADLRAPVRAGERYVAMGWPMGVDGRKRYAGSAVFDETGRLCALARATWIAINGEQRR